MPTRASRTSRAGVTYTARPICIACFSACWICRSRSITIIVRDTSLADLRADGVKARDIWQRLNFLL
jgi:hypothetical protein